MRKRLDILLVERGLIATRERAQSEILAGNVLVGESVAGKCGMQVPEDAVIRIKESFPYVSRGALKLLRALDHFQIDVKDKIAIDIGSSTGGFTEVLLERGAPLVYAVDSGTNQLDWKLRSDRRVRVMENTNAREIDRFRFDPPPQVAAIDVSFISVTKILPALLKVMAPGFVVFVLIKPQFELDRNDILKGGRVRPEDRGRAVEKVLAFAGTIGLEHSEVIESPITGAKSGNVEFLCVLVRPAGPGPS